MEPEPETAALVAQIRAGIYDKQARLSPLGNLPEENNQENDFEQTVPQSIQGIRDAKPPLAIPHNLSSPLGAFIGREQVIDYVIEQIIMPTGRLLTIVGPGGMGKTTLAQEVGLRLLTLQLPDFPDGLFPDGIFFVALSGIKAPEQAQETQAPHGVNQSGGANQSDRVDQSDSVGQEEEDRKNLTKSGELILTAIANSIGCKLQSDIDRQQQVQAHLRARRLLLILDNFEQLLPNAGILVSLLANAPMATMMVTSRGRLTVRGEIIVPLHKLSLPSRSPAASPAKQTKSSSSSPIPKTPPRSARSPKTKLPKSKRRKFR